MRGTVSSHSWLEHWGQVLLFPRLDAYRGNWGPPQRGGAWASILPAYGADGSHPEASGPCATKFSSSGF